MVFAFQKFRPYLIVSHVILFTDNTAVKSFLLKKDAKPKLLRSMLLLQEFDYDIRDMKGFEDHIAQCLSWTVCARGTNASISECFSNEQ